MTGSWSHIFVCVIIGGVLGAILGVLIKFTNKMLYNAKMKKFRREEEKRKIWRDVAQTHKEMYEIISNRLPKKMAEINPPKETENKSGCPECFGQWCGRDDFDNYGRGLENTLCPRAAEYRRNRGY